MAPSNSYLSHHGVNGVGSLALCGERRSRLKWGQVSTCPHHRHSHHASSTQKQHASVGWAALVESQQRQQRTAKFTIINFHVCMYVGWHIYESDSPQICHVHPCAASTHLNTMWNIVKRWDGQVAFPKQPGPQVTNSWTSHGRHGNSRMASSLILLCNVV